MPEPVFFARRDSLTLGEVAALTGATLADGEARERRIAGVATLDQAGPEHLAYADDPRFAETLMQSLAGVCLVTPRLRPKVPPASVALVVADAQRAYGQVVAAFYPGALRPASLFGATGVSPGSYVHPSARLEHGAVVDPGAVIGPGAEIGSGTLVQAGAVIGPEVRLGRDCNVGAGVTVQHALIGNRVIIHPGARIGQDGFGFAMGPKGHAKMPQIGRVIIQDDVEIGANTTIDRGASHDTVIGEGTKIDNLVQVGHNCVIGRHCVIVSQVGLSGSTVLEDFVVLAGKVGTAGHLRIGAGTQVAADSNVKDSLPPGGRYGGSPAKPVREWFREITALKRLASSGRLPKDGPPSSDA